MNSGAVAPLEGKAADDDAVEITEEDGEEEDPSKYLCSPCQPTAEEEEEHRCTHWPFRSWCRFCVMGRALGQPHRSSETHSDIPRVGIDYFFITKGAFRRKQ